MVLSNCLIPPATSAPAITTTSPYATSNVVNVGYVGCGRSWPVPSEGDLVDLATQLQGTQGILPFQGFLSAATVADAGDDDDNDGEEYPEDYYGCQEE